jgi:hypothetical protein
MRKVKQLQVRRDPHRHSLHLRNSPILQAKIGLEYDDLILGTAHETHQKQS